MDAWPAALPDTRVQQHIRHHTLLPCAAPHAVRVPRSVAACNASTLAWPWSCAMCHRFETSLADIVNHHQSISLSVTRAPCRAVHMAMHESRKRQDQETRKGMCTWPCVSLSRDEEGHAGDDVVELSAVYDVVSLKSHLAQRDATLRPVLKHTDLNRAASAASAIGYM